MLTFFRRIRKSLLASSQARKYLVYAIGEIALVVIGILIALQINNANEWRKEKAREIEILKSIEKGLGKDLVDINDNIWFHKRFDSSALNILNHMENDFPFHDSLSIHFGNISNGTTAFVHSTSAFQTLKSLGVDLISNGNLRDQIIDLYDAQYGWMLLNEKIMVEVTQHGMLNIFNSRSEETFNIENRATWEGKVYPINYKELKRDNEFRYYLKTLKNLNTNYLEGYLYRVEELISEIISNIQKELERLEKN